MHISSLLHLLRHYTKVMKLTEVCIKKKAPIETQLSLTHKIHLASPIYTTIYCFHVANLPLHLSG